MNTLVCACHTSLTQKGGGREIVSMRQRRKMEGKGAQREMKRQRKKARRESEKKLEWSQREKRLTELYYFIT